MHSAATTSCFVSQWDAAGLSVIFVSRNTPAPMSTTSATSIHGLTPARSAKKSDAVPTPLKIKSSRPTPVSRKAMANMMSHALSSGEFFF